ncbi:Las1-domain-containing protein [Coprinellus micaceus]|uniref:Las1-domain-containing protein n=1 Tax=Coprinellus micaceus TaxID=71717 RepID=A0A4Y7TYI2_COPMI|nr:Las1-domain-containing protein [Coprinellus micaceus]
MRLPRRVPWASIGELEQLCSWIYSDEHDYESKVLAINRLSAWKAITTLPHALESAISLLVVVTHDAPHSNLSNLSLRQSYATAIIRLVNGLVDPLQLGAYARSIASIAKQLGLPLWLVELRHAATHEELPSLSLLREAARQSLSWLLYNYFLPTISPQSESPSLAPPLRPLRPILRQYKECMKIVSRDASLTSKHTHELTGFMKDIDRWLSETAVAANVSFGEVGWESSTCRSGSQSPESLSGQDLKERWALDRLCGELLEKGALVPLSKRKRTSPGSFFPPSQLIAIWAPLLKFIQLQHTDFALLLTTRICSQLVVSELSSLDLIALSEPKLDPTYLACLSRWANWTISSLPDSDSKDELRKDAVMQLLQELGKAMVSPKQHKASALELTQVLCEGDSDLEAALAVLSGPAKQAKSQGWEPTDLAVMQATIRGAAKIGACGTS